MRSALLVLFVAAAGCAYGSTTIPFVLVEERIEVSPNATLQADFGPHCERARLDEFPSRVHLMWYQGQNRPDFALVRDFRGVRANGSFATMSSGLDAEWSILREGSFALTSPFEPQIEVAALRWTPESVEVDGTPLVAGEPFVVVHERDVATGPARSPEDPAMVHVTETMTFTFHPGTKVTWESNRLGACL